jgi:uncharacterized protein (TIGR02271 family)
MLDRTEFVKTHPDIRTGMTVYSTTGEKLGVIEQIGEDNILIEKGRIFHKGANIPFDDIEEVREDQVIVRLRGEGEEWEEAHPIEEMQEYERGRAGEEARIPLREEELEVQKREREGEVLIHKDVYTETERLEVPVQKEEVRVEHVPAGEARAGEMGEKAFREEDIRIPVREEEVEVTKRPVVKEELRVSKDVRTEEEEVSGEVRKERAKVERNEPKQKK